MLISGRIDHGTVVELTNGHYAVYDLVAKAFRLLSSSYQEAEGMRRLCITGINESINVPYGSNSTIEVISRNGPIGKIEDIFFGDGVKIAIMKVLSLSVPQE